MPSDRKLGRTYLGTVPRSSPATRVAPLSASTTCKYSSPSCWFAAQLSALLSSRGAKCVDRIKSEDVVDAENVEDSFYAAHPLSPPGEILRAHRRPVINRDPPVLSPLDRELVIFEIWFRRRAPRPIEMEDVPLSENIRAVITDAEGNIAHKRDPVFLGKFPQLTPLFVRDPLHVGKEFFARRKPCPHLC